jgi:hypothetical protein
MSELSWRLYNLLSEQNPEAYVGELFNPGTPNEYVTLDGHFDLQKLADALTANAPVVLVGTDAEDGSLGVVGLYETEQAAQAAVQQGRVPSGHHYAVMTPAMNSISMRRARG